MTSPRASEHAPQAKPTWRIPSISQLTSWTLFDHVQSRDVRRLPSKPCFRERGHHQPSAKRPPKKRRFGIDATDLFNDRQLGEEARNDAQFLELVSSRLHKLAVENLEERDEDASRQWMPSDRTGRWESGGGLTLATSLALLLAAARVTSMLSLWRRVMASSSVFAFSFGGGVCLFESGLDPSDDGASKNAAGVEAEARALATSAS